MKRDNPIEYFYDALQQIIENTGSEALLEVLTEKARNIEIKKREEFENALLSLAQNVGNKEIRPVLYETMVSLQAIWNQHLPKKDLQKKIWVSINSGNTDTALLNYKELARQGLDYLGTFHKKDGELIPLVTGKEDLLLNYNEKELTLYTPQLLELANIPVLGSLSIIDVLILSPFNENETIDLNNHHEPKLNLWLLMEQKNRGRKILHSGLDELQSLKSLDYGYLEHRAIDLDGEANAVSHLSYYQNHLLSISKSTIYCWDKNAWKKWYITDNEITTWASTGKGFWVGHANGDVFVLKDLEHVGVRDSFNEFSETISSIHESEEFVIVVCKNSSCITDHAGNLILEPVKTGCNIIQADILNKEWVLLHLANGMLIVKELKQGNTCWQINLESVYEILFSFRNNIYCGMRSGEIKRFEIPRFDRIAIELEKNNIYVDKHSSDSDPDAPIKYMVDFIGRRGLLQEIKDNGNAHVLLFGEPKIGKTSILNVLPDTLSEMAKCCYIDMAHLLKEAHSYTEFEKHFIDKCLEHHFIDISELSHKGRYQGLREMVKKIKGDKKFCVFCLDNFFIPHHFDEQNLNKFKTFLRSLFIHPEARIIMTCSSKKKKDATKVFIEWQDIFSRRKLLERPIPLFSEDEVKNALRKKISLDQSIINENYEHIGRFPHLVHLYDKWNLDQQTLVEYSEAIAREYSERIFEYFRDLSSDAYLLIATCLKYNLISDKNTYTTFYENFPFLKSSLPKRLMENALMEIDRYGESFQTSYDRDYFYISMKSNARLFIEASKHISWLDHFSPLYRFTSSPDLEKAHNAADMFTHITGSELDSDEKLNKFIKKFKETYYVNMLTTQGRRVLDMPLSTFIVIPLQSWKTDTHKRAFNDLYVSLQEFKRLHGESAQGGTVQKFYILLIELHGIPDKKLKDDLIGLERISIIDTSMIKDIILDKSPREKASDYIFDQLSIKERSPYTTSGAVPDELFFGREMEIQLIRGLPENIGIFGTRTIGKTSLLRRLNKDLKSQSRWKVYAMDCSRIDSEEILLKNLAEKMDIPFDSISDMEKFRRFITREAETKNQQYLFLLDEVDRLVQYDIGHEEKIFETFNRLCTETMENDESPARFILCGFRQMFDQMKNPNSRLYNFMVFLPLKPLDVESALALVTQPIEKIRVKWKDREDALYLVNSCSCHPRLLQSACHSLLAILDSKKRKKDMIERTDVDQALASAEFREMCMRFYHNPEEEKEDNAVKKENKKAGSTRTLLNHFRIRSKNERLNESEKPFLNDLHRITILSAIRLLFEEYKESFTITDIHSEIKKHIPGISPNAMRIILDHLCLSGIVNLKNESMLIARKDTKLQGKIDKQNLIAKEKHFSIEKPDVYKMEDKVFPKFIYEFGVNIFPTLLVAHFGGIEQCKEELKQLIAKKDWEEWLRRH